MTERPADKPPLWERMRDLAERRPEHSEALRKSADAMEAAVKRAYAEDGTKDDTKSMLGALARARRLWCDITGEPLV